MNKHALAAIVVAALGAPAFAVDIPLANGSFDNGSVPPTGFFGFFTSWTTQVGNPGPGNYSGAFATYAGITPTDGARMALISNQGLSFVSLQQAVPIALQNMPFFTFNYVYLTTDPANTALSARDTFTVVIDYYSDAAGLNQIATQAVTMDTDQLNTSVVVPGAPFNGATANLSQANGPGGWRYVSVALSVPTAAYANFTFYLDNNGTSGVGPGISALLIDNTRINPEPGTMALFGLGAAGLGALVLRRRRAAKASAAT